MTWEMANNSVAFGWIAIIFGLLFICAFFFAVSCYEFRKEEQDIMIAESAGEPPSFLQRHIIGISIIPLVLSIICIIFGAKLIIKGQTFKNNSINIEKHLEENVLDAEYELKKYQEINLGT